MRGEITSKVPSELISSTADNIVVSADGVYDYNLKRYLEDINKDLDNKLESITDLEDLELIGNPLMTFNAVQDYITLALEKLSNYYVIRMNCADSTEGEDEKGNYVLYIDLMPGQTNYLQRLFNKISENGIESVHIFAEDTEVQNYYPLISTNEGIYTVKDKRQIKLVFEDKSWQSSTTTRYDVTLFEDGTAKIEGRLISYDVSDSLSKIKNTAETAKTDSNNAVTKVASLETDIESLKELLESIIFKDITCTCKISGTTVYKGFDRSLTVTGETNAAADDVAKIEIMEGSNQVAEANSKKVTYQFTASGSMLRTRTFNCVATFGSAYGGKTKTSSNVTFSYVNPIFRGFVQNRTDGDLEGFNAESFAASNAIEENLYSKDAPVSSLSGKSITFNMTNHSRVFVITTENKLGATEGVSPFPFERFYTTINGVNYYVYVSSYIYDESHTITFNNSENY